MKHISLNRIPSDRLRVFVSSTIKECVAERSSASNAIRSINHEPILFEEIGARPHPPREVYKQRLEDSAIFVGIYRHSYGWIAPEMDISGIEDEFRIASKRGMDRLIYVFSGQEQREERLEAFIESVKNAGLTVAFYENPDQLYKLVRNDVTAVISARFAEQSLFAVEGSGPDELLVSLLPDERHRFRRCEVEQRVLQEVESIRRLVISGPLGAGKTILLAQLAAREDWVFVDGRNLSRLDLFARSANALRVRIGQMPVTYITEQSAKEALLHAWQSSSGETLAVDSPVDLEVLWELPVDKNRLVTTSRTKTEVLAEQQIELPPLTRDEIKTWVTALRGKPPESGELTTIVDQSGGNPLYLRFYAFGALQNENLTLKELEVNVFRSLSPRAREVVSYLLLAGLPLSLHDLEHLLEVTEGPEFIAGIVTEGSSLVHQSKGRIELIHEHPQQTLLEHLQNNPTRLAYFSVRLGKHLEKTGNYVGAFNVYHAGGERRLADRVLDKAVHQAALRGGGSPSITIFERMAERARENANTEEEIHALLALAYALYQTGCRQEVKEVLTRSRSITEGGTDSEYGLMVREKEIIFDLEEKGSSERISSLLELREVYVSKELEFDAARITTLLTVEYITCGDYQLAENTSRDALEYFLSIGDEYGARIAKINLATVLSRLDNRDEEATEIERQLEETINPSEYPRERAVICNLLTRKHRELGNTTLAAEYATEAINIGNQLGDRHVITINRINLGNVRRDEGILDQALEEYRRADRVAADGGFRVNEAAANELIASVLNARGDHSLALVHALHASSTARNAGDYLVASRADEERAKALAALRREEEAVDAYIDAANAAATIQPGSSFFAELICEALKLCISIGRYDLKIDILSKVFLGDQGLEDAETKLDMVTTTISALPIISQTVGVEMAIPIIAFAVADLFEDAPTLIERKIVLRSIDEILSSDSGVSNDSGLIAIVAILMASSWDALKLSDLVDVAERISQFSPDIYFKPHTDGAGHWTVHLDLGGGVIATITQLDDDPKISLATMIIALLLRGLSPNIQSHILETEELPRREVIVNVVSQKEFTDHVDVTLSGLKEMPSGFAVSQSTDITLQDQPPIVLILAKEFGSAWRPDLQRISEMHQVLAEFLRVLALHLLAREIEPDVLLPKIGGLLRRIVYRGQTEENSKNLAN